MRLIAYTGGEEQPITRSSRMVIAKSQRPQPVVLDRVSVCVAEEAVEAPTVEVINSDLPAACIADQQVVAEEAKVCRGKCHTPGRIQPRTVLQPLQQLTFRREFVHESEAREIEVIVLRSILFGIGHIQIPVDLLHVERRKTLGDLTIKEPGAPIVFGNKIHRIEFCVVNLDAPSTNIRNVEEKWSTSRHLRDGRAFVHSPGGGGGITRIINDHECVIGEVVGINCRAPGDYGSVFGHEGESCAGGSALHLERESRSSRENHSRWRARYPTHW